MRILVDPEELGEDLLTEAIEQKAGTPVQVAAGGRTDQMPHKPQRGIGREQHRRRPGRRAAGPETFQSAPSSPTSGDLGRSESIEAALIVPVPVALHTLLV